ncbi:hypothetical protein [Duganella levis]|uniref:hypothetical protein n=1 Tax=Duganella levis TaxID=2692169 RepID=UPI0019280779|nr:hypothetical protein [Duganella levis]
MRAALFLSLLGVALSAQAAEDWLLQLDRWGNPSYMTLHFQDEHGKLSGTLDGDALTGTRSNGQLVLSVIDKQGKRYEYKGSTSVDRLQGTANFPDTNDSNARANHPFSARRLPERTAATPQRYEYVPKDYSNTFSTNRLPVLKVWPGDTIHTTTIDSGGVDEHGVTRALYGNPQTGPFFMMGAEAGDTLVVHLLKLKPNRDYADSLDAIVGRAQTAGMASRASNLGKPVRWKLDRERGVASPEQPSNTSSMAVEFRVELIKGKAIGMPRIESPTHIMTLGQAGSLDDALRLATAGMTQWLQQDYGLSLSDSAILLGSTPIWPAAASASPPDSMPEYWSERRYRQSSPQSANHPQQAAVRGLNGDEVGCLQQRHIDGNGHRAGMQRDGKPRAWPERVMVHVGCHQSAGVAGLTAPVAASIKIRN